MKQDGLTLVEMMVTVGVLGVLITVGFPAYQTMQANNQLAIQVNDLVGAFSLGRSEAVTRGTPVAICPKDPVDPTICSTDVANWFSEGYLVFVDPNTGTAGSFQSATDTLLLDGEALEDGETAETSLDDAFAYVRFDADGAVSPNGTAHHIQLSHDVATATDRCLIVAATGAIRSHRMIDEGTTCP